MANIYGVEVWILATSTILWISFDAEYAHQVRSWGVKLDPKRIVHRTDAFCWFKPGWSRWKDRKWKHLPSMCWYMWIYVYTIDSIDSYIYIYIIYIYIIYIYIFWFSEIGGKQTLMVYNREWIYKSMIWYPRTSSIEDLVAPILSLNHFTPLSMLWSIFKQKSKVWIPKIKIIQNLAFAWRFRICSVDFRYVFHGSRMNQIYHNTMKPLSVVKPKSEVFECNNIKDTSRYHVIFVITYCYHMINPSHPPLFVCSPRSPPAIVARRCCRKRGRCSRSRPVLAVKRRPHVATPQAIDDGEWIRGIPEMMAELFRLVNYCNLPKCQWHWLCFL